MTDKAAEKYKEWCEIIARSRGDAALWAARLRLGDNDNSGLIESTTRARTQALAHTHARAQEAAESIDKLLTANQPFAWMDAKFVGKYFSLQF